MALPRGTDTKNRRWEAAVAPRLCACHGVILAASHEASCGGPCKKFSQFGRLAARPLSLRIASPLAARDTPSNPVTDTLGTLPSGLQHHLLAAVALVQEQVISQRSLLELEAVGDDEAGVDLPPPDPLEQRLHVAVHVTLTGPDRQ
jgi:hypothetical protein